MITFTATREQSDNLEGLAYWVSDRAWSRERGKLDEYEETGGERCKRTFATRCAQDRSHFDRGGRRHGKRTIL